MMENIVAGVLILIVVGVVVWMVIASRHSSEEEKD